MKERLSNGQDPKEVAQLIADIVEKDQPHLRYQTSTMGIQTVAKGHTDPTGETSLTLIKEMWQDLSDRF